MADWIDGDWVDGEWVEAWGVGPPLPPGFWPHNYWLDGYWEPSYWGIEPRRPAGGAFHPTRRKPPQPGGPAIVTNKAFTNTLVQQALDRLDAEEIKKAEIAAANEVFDRKQHFSELGKKGAEVKREKALAKEQQRKERAAPPRSETAQFVEQKKSDREKMSHLRALKRIAKEERRRRVGG